MEITKEQLIERIKQMPDNIPIVVGDDDGAVYDKIYDLEDFVKVEKMQGHFNNKEFCIDFDNEEKHDVILING